MKYDALRREIDGMLSALPGDWTVEELRLDQEVGDAWYSAVVRTPAAAPPSPRKARAKKRRKAGTDCPGLSLFRRRRARQNLGSYFGLGFSRITRE